MNDERSTGPRSAAARTHKRPVRPRSPDGLWLAFGALFALVACNHNRKADAKPEPTAKVVAKPATGDAAKPCASTAECGEGRICSTETGACDRPPGCGPEDICAAVCYGTCVDRPAAATGSCQTDADCRAFSDYCTGCDCRALAKGAPDPTCAGPGVRCLVDPCLDKRGRCDGGRCVIATGRR